jgi:hypothetical protein
MPDIPPGKVQDALYGISHLIDDWANCKEFIPTSLQAFERIEAIIQETRQGTHTNA